MSCYAGGGWGWGAATSREAALFFIYKLFAPRNGKLKKNIHSSLPENLHPPTDADRNVGLYGDTVRPLHRNRRGPVSDGGDELKHMQQILQSM